MRAVQQTRTPRHTPRRTPDSALLVNPVLLALAIALVVSGTSGSCEGLCLCTKPSVGRGREGLEGGEGAIGALHSGRVYGQAGSGGMRPRLPSPLALCVA
jgi:hypothetical protein